MAVSKALRFVKDDYQAANSRWQALHNETPRRQLAMIAAMNERYRGVTVVLLSAILAETAINAYLALKLSPTDWQAKEKTRTVFKWTDLPKLVEPSYILPALLREDLEKLVGCRNAIGHPKPTVHEFGVLKPLHEGTADDFYSPTHDDIQRWYLLTIHLTENLCRYDQEAIHFLITFRENLRVR